VTTFQGAEEERWRADVDPTGTDASGAGEGLAGVKGEPVRVPLERREGEIPSRPG